MQTLEYWTLWNIYRQLIGGPASTAPIHTLTLDWTFFSNPSIIRTGHAQIIVSFIAAAKGKYELGFF
jgi:hypothetical protein